MTAKLPYRVLIIGAGNIGAFFDRPHDRRVLTHAHAFTANKRFLVVGFVDSDQKKAAQAARWWGTRMFKTIAEAFDQAGPIDVVVVATSDATHANIFADLAGRWVRLVFMEKPLAVTLSEVYATVRISRKKKMPVAVNYSRRFVKEFKSLRDRIAAGAYGSFLQGSGYYGKGLLHNGSHMIDLVRFLIGEIKEGKTCGGANRFSKNDPSLSLHLRLAKGGNFFLHAVDSRIVSVFEADLFFEKGRIKILNSGEDIEEIRIEKSPVFSGYKVFGPVKRYKTSLSLALAQAADNIVGYLDRRAELLCDLKEAARSAEVCLKLIQQAKKR